MGANLFQQYLQPARSVMDYMGDMDAQDLRRAQLEGAQRQNALQALVAQQQQKEMAYTDEGRNLIRSTYAANAGAAPNVLASKFAEIPHEAAQKQAAAMRKAMQDQETHDVDVGAKKAKTSRELFDESVSRMNFLGNTISSAKDQRTYDVVKQVLAAANFDVSKFPPQFDPEYVETLGKATMTMKDRLEQGWKEKEFGLKTNQFGETVRHNKSTEGLTARGQNMADQRARETIAVQRDAAGGVDWKQDTDGNWVGLPKKAVPGGQVVPATTVVPGKREVQSGSALGIIAEAEKLIGKGTNSYMGAGLDQALRLFGVSTEGADVSAKLKALEGALMMAQPRMEGPQSDKDVALYRQMAGQIGDSTVPADMKAAALDGIKKLHQRYAKPSASAVTAKPTVSNW
jgi:hypothetical protein